LTLLSLEGLKKNQVIDLEMPNRLKPTVRQGNVKDRREQAATGQTAGGAAAAFDDADQTPALQVLF
jgi:hypothetical protein